MLKKNNDRPETERNYKDRLFRMVFREKKELLSLYNALNNTAYTNEDDITIVTLENALYMSMKNDLSFVINSRLNLYEHQASINPNMPLRDLFYIAAELEKLVDEKRLYSSSLIKIPTPQFVVFYNGTEKQPERRVLKLSDAFEQKTEEPQLELSVLQLNINKGNNTELLERCQTLKEYMLYVEKVRQCVKEGAVLDIAVERAVNDCIKENILKEFLSRCRKEVVAVSIFEYNEEEVLQCIREDEYRLGEEAGMQRGMQRGIQAGQESGIKAVIAMCKEFHLEKDAILQKLQTNFEITPEKAEEYLQRYEKPTISTK